MAKLILTDIDNLENENSAVAAMAANNAATEAAMENTVSLDGTAPNTMTGNVDFSGGGRVLNLPAPKTALEPLRLADLNTFIGGGTISTIPSGGNTGDVLTKNSGTNFDIGWASDSSAVVAGNSIVITGTSPATIALSGTPGLGTPVSGVLTSCTGLPIATGLATGTSANLASVISDKTGTGSLVFATSPTLVTPLLGTPTSGVLTNCTGLPVASLTGLGASVGTALTATLNGSGAIAATTSPVFVTPTLGAATATSINKVAFTAPVSLATVTLATASTLTTTSTVSVGAGQYTGEPTTGSATAGNIGEYIESVIASGSAVSQTTATPTNVTSIVLSAGDWDVDAMVTYTTSTSTSVTRLLASISLVTATQDLTNGRTAVWQMAAIVPGVVTAAFSQAVPPLRFSMSGSTTVFLVAVPTFTVGPLTAFGILRARRAR